MILILLSSYDNAVFPGKKYLFKLFGSSCEMSCDNSITHIKSDLELHEGQNALHLINEDYKDYKDY